mmetsp:Transcript_4608/g.8476  ORF Transcript_4608/g.8476 Transcript_4608/m.8476 type:complete len:266 (-) Transcript_4608:1485-2282(-)
MSHICVRRTVPYRHLMLTTNPHMEEPMVDRGITQDMMDRFLHLEILVQTRWSCLDEVQEAMKAETDMLRVIRLRAVQLRTLCHPNNLEMTIIASMKALWNPETEGRTKVIIAMRGGTIHLMIKQTIDVHTQSESRLNGVTKVVALVVIMKIVVLSITDENLTIESAEAILDIILALHESIMVQGNMDEVGEEVVKDITTTTIGQLESIIVPLAVQKEDLTRLMVVTVIKSLVTPSILQRARNHLYRLLHCLWKAILPHSLIVIYP